MAVDLPAPLGPRRATTSPGRRERLEAVEGDGGAVALGDVGECGDGLLWHWSGCLGCDLFRFEGDCA